MSSFKEYRTAEYPKLLEDTDVKRWYNNNAKGSVIRADVYLRALGRFCKEIGMTPKEFAKLPIVKLENTTIDFIDALEAKKNPESGRSYSPGYIESYLKAIRSWALWNRKVFQRNIKVSNITKRPTLENERIPTQDELRRVLYSDTTPLRTRVSIALIAFTGARPETQGDYLGLEGLRIGDFSELSIKKNEIQFVKVPTLITIREEISKSRHWYPTFLCEEGCNLLKQYLERRIADGEVLNEKSGIIVTDAWGAKQREHFGRYEDKSPFIRTTILGNCIREAMRAVDLPWRPYVFRSYFDTIQMLGESKGLVSHPYAQCFMGHGGDIEATYTLRKGEIPPEILEDMRGAYGKVSEMLMTQRRSTIERDELGLAVRREVLSFYDFTEEDILGLGDLMKYSMPELRDIAEKKRYKVNGAGQTVVTRKELKDYLKQNYKFESWLSNTNSPDDEAIISLPKA